MEEAENKGNGAREALMRIGFNSLETDNLLAALWREGFKVVPLEEET